MDVCFRMCVCVCVGAYVSFEAHMLVINLIAFLLILPALWSSNSNGSNANVDVLNVDFCSNMRTC